MVIPCFLIKEHLLFLQCKKIKGYNKINELPLKEIMKKWWDYMKDIMETNPDNSPVTAFLEEVFLMN